MGGDSTFEQVGFFSTTATTKFVRRELRTLHDKDREYYFQTLQDMVSFGEAEGEAAYGKDFWSVGRFTAAHTTARWQFHDNLFFSTSHPAMQLKFEKSLLAVAADKGRLFLPYWDFLLDAELGERWVDAQVYSDGWFGSVKTAKPDWRPSGRFHTVRSIYDPEGITYPGSLTNLYGYIGLPFYDNNKSPWFQRSAHFCGMQLEQGFANCQNVRICYNTYKSSNNSLWEFDHCVEKDVHANLHAMHAGMWNCAVDWGTFKDKHSEWANPTLLSIMGTYMKAAIKIVRADGYMSCPTSCDVHDSEKSNKECRCTSSFPGVDSPGDVDSLSDHTAYIVLSKWWEYMYLGAYQGSDYVS